jgi:hypothetical protein
MFPIIPEVICCGESQGIVGWRIYHPADRQYHSEKSSESCDKSSILLYRELHHTQRKAAFLEAKPCCVNHRGGSNSSYSTNFIDHGSFRRNDHPANGACKHRLVLVGSVFVRSCDMLVPGVASVQYVPFHGIRRVGSASCSRVRK